MSVTVIVVRLVWVFPATYLPRLLEPAAFASAIRSPPWQQRRRAGWSGMRGIVSLAIALALPYTLGDQPFPQRSVMIFFTFCVVFVTLVLQGSHARPADRMARRHGDEPQPATRDEPADSRARSRHSAASTARRCVRERRRWSARSPTGFSKSTISASTCCAAKSAKTKRRSRRRRGSIGACKTRRLPRSGKRSSRCARAGEIPDDIYRSIEYDLDLATLRLS